MSPTLPLHWENYVVPSNQLGKYFWNTVLVTGISVPGVLLVSSMSAFVFARYSFRAHR